MKLLIDHLIDFYLNQFLNHLQSLHNGTNMSLYTKYLNNFKFSIELDKYKNEIVCES